MDDIFKPFPTVIFLDTAKICVSKVLFYALCVTYFHFNCSCSLLSVEESKSSKKEGEKEEGGGKPEKKSKKKPGRVLYDKV